MLPDEASVDGARALIQSVLSGEEAPAASSEAASGEAASDAAA